MSGTLRKSEFIRRDSLPFRQSKLTYLLKDSIGGNSKMIMIANIWAESSHLEETISTLRFASRISKVTSCPSKTQHLDESFLIKKYEREIRDLKAELAMHDTLTGRGRISYEPYSPEQQYEQQMLAQKFLVNEVDDLNIESIRQVKELFYQFRNLYKSILLESKRTEDNIMDDKNNQKNTTKNTENPKNEKNNKIAIGQEEFITGFGLGMAPSDPVGKEQKNQQFSDKTNFVKQSKPAREEKIDINIKIANKFINLSSKDFNEDEIFNNGKLDKKVLFENFKEGRGKIFAQEIKTIVEEVGTSKTKFDAERELCEKLKTKISDLQATLKGNDRDHVKDTDEELEPTELLKNLKKKYNSHYENYIYFKKHIKELEKKLMEKKKEFLESFNAILKKNFSINLDFFEENEKTHADNNLDDQMNSAEIIFDQTHQKFETLMKAKKMEKIKNLRN